MRGIRGATTVTENNEKEILTTTKTLIIEMAEKNNVEPESISHVFISVTKELNAGFPAKVLREIPDWAYVPVMCMNEIDVPHGLKKCIRIMMVAETSLNQKEVQHVFHNEAVKLRPDLIPATGE